MKHENMKTNHENSTRKEHMMKRFGFYMAAAALSMGISGTAALSSQAGLSTIIIGGNCQSGNRNTFNGNPSAANSCINPQNILSYITGYCPTPYGLNNLNNGATNNFCSSNDCFNDEEYFPGQRPQGNCPTQNQPVKDNPNQTNPDKDKPGQTDPDKDKPGQIDPDKDKPGQTDPDKDKPGQTDPDKDKPGQTDPDNNNSGQDTPEDNTNKSYVQQVIDLVNEERAKAGLSPLTESSAVSRAAYTRSQEITRNFSHTRPDGTSFSTVLRQNGVSFTSSGENIAYGQRTPAEVINTWMNSSGHRANILNSNYTTIGVGCYQAANGTLYWTQLFTR